MIKICPDCKYQFEYDPEKKENTKCPRCGKIYREKTGCENCKGCSMFKSCKSH